MLNTVKHHLFVNSLRNRLLVSAGLPLLCFFLVAGYYLDRELQNYARASLEERLQNVFYGLLSITDWNPDLGFQVYGTLPEPGLSSPAAGLAASIVMSDGHILWKSPAYDVLKPSLPPRPPQGKASFTLPQADAGHHAVFAYTVAWEVLPGETESLSFFVIGDTTRYAEQVFRARAGVLVSSLVLGILMLLFQLVIVRRGLSPLARVERDLQRLHQGELATIEDHYPREIQTLANTLNNVLDSQRQQLERYRNALANLSHGLKTPLAVLRSELDAGKSMDRSVMRQQCERLGELMEYHLARGQVAGRMLTGGRVAIRHQVIRLRETLLKIYRDKRVDIEVSIDPDLRVRADSQDLMEVIGNLMENGCKWAAGRVHVSAEEAAPGVWIRVDDDGPGIPEGQWEHLLERGARADEAVAGHGLGLAIVQDIVQQLEGRVDIAVSPQLGGASVRVWLPE